jgi:hypothetical protein
MFYKITIDDDYIDDNSVKFEELKSYTKATRAFQTKVPSNLFDAINKCSHILFLKDNRIFNPNMYNYEIYCKLKKAFFFNLYNNLACKEPKPFVFICNYPAEKVSKIHNIAILNNSSIWFWYIDISKGKDIVEKNIQDVISHIKYYEDNNFYNENAIESLKYNLRLQKENYLDFDSNSKAHGAHITPKIYHNELECADTILSINTEKDETEYKYPELIDLHNATFRILLIDDKDGKKEEKADYCENKSVEANNELSKGELIKKLMGGDILKPFVVGKLHELKDINNGLPNNLAKYSILEIIEIIQSKVDDDKKLSGILASITDNTNAVSEKIKDLKELSKQPSNIKKEIDILISRLEACKDFSIKDYIVERLIWKEKDIEHYFYTTDEDEKGKYGEKFFDISKHKTSENVQIIQVTNLADAITILTDESIRFDLILLDYLLGYKPDGERQLSTDFFIWFQDKDGEKEEIDYLRRELCKIKDREKGQSAKCPQANNIQPNNKCSSCEERQFILKENKELRQRLKSNRGPLRKLWIFPITAFNETLIDDLTNNNVRLIDYYWHISKGADPITTPYLFLRMLNSFLYLQLEESVFLEHEIKDFLRKSIERLKKVERSGDFIAIMGSDYTEFVQNFMNRSIIYRDKQNYSLFANYIWKNFYANEKYKNEHILVNYIHRFYHRCAFGGNSEYRKMILFWRDMKLFIENNFPDWVKDDKLNLETYYTKLNEVYPK